jgi:hypothetical protein
MYHHQYQHLYAGPYGLVDNHQRTIWINVDSADQALAIKKTFESKLSLRIVDLRKFNNFNSATINSKTCLSWQLPIDQADIPDIDVDFKTVLEQSASNELVQSPSTFLTSDDRINELQDQILLFVHILSLCDLIKNDNTISITDQYLDEIRKIFLVEIHIEEIKSKLCILSRSYIGKSNLPGLVMHTIGCNPYA